MSSDAPRVIDLFCGAGGSSYGAKLAGCQIRAGVDYWEPAIKTYNANFPDAIPYHADIKKLSPKKVKSEIGDVDLILASPECTSHSRAKGAAERSEESRQGAFQVIRYAKVFQPTWIVLENVVEMRAWADYGKLLNDLKRLGYLVRDDVVLNAKDFGVPQSRERLFIMCSRLGMPEKPAPGEIPVQAVSTIISENTYRFTPLRKEGRAKPTLARADHAIQNLGPNEPFLIVYYGSAKNGGHGGWQRLSEPLRTVTTLDRFAYVVPNEDGHEMRMLQPEELKLAMGYGSEFKLNEVDDLTRRDRVKLMGNGVCPPVIKTIVEALINQKKE